jgi:hypothetical protein
LDGNLAAFQSFSFEFAIEPNGTCKGPFFLLPVSLPNEASGAAATAADATAALVIKFLRVPIIFYVILFCSKLLKLCPGWGRM